MRNESLPARGVWIEMKVLDYCWTHYCQSLPARGVWIEILMVMPLCFWSLVAPRKGSVD